MHHLPLLLRFNGMLFFFFFLSSVSDIQMKSNNIMFVFVSPFSSSMTLRNPFSFHFPIRPQGEGNQTNENWIKRSDRIQTKRKTNASKSIFLRNILKFTYRKRNTISGWAAKKEKESASLFYIFDFHFSRQIRRCFVSLFLIPCCRGSISYRFHLNRLVERGYRISEPRVQESGC